MYRCLAALLLLPASCKVYRTPRAWLKALAAGPTYFFSIVVKSGPKQVLPSPSLWRKLLVYWPMKAGIELVRSRSIRATARKVWHRACRKGQSLSLPKHKTYAAPEPLSAETILRMMHTPGLSVISFDIFDTLLERPVLRPRDIFHLVAAAVDQPLGVDFIKMRWSAEEETGIPNATLHDIYAHMKKKFGLDDTTVATLMAEELRCEENLLAIRPDMWDCYNEAVKLGKRIIAISDMYIPGELLHGILKRKGYDQIAAVYVSCDYGKRKSNGTLYGDVLAAEKIEPAALLHIGDNHQSDCLAALACGIAAIHCPPPLTRRLEADPEFAALLDGAVQHAPAWSLLLGFALQRSCSAHNAPAQLDNIRDVKGLISLTLAPLLTGYCLSLIGNKSLRHDYSCIYFASRDGYLPHKVYNIIAKHVPAMPAVYFQAGRRAYLPFLYSSFHEYAAALPPAENSNYTLHDFIAAHFAGTKLLHVLEAELSSQDKARSFFAERACCLTLLRKYENEIETLMEEKRARAKQYYQKIFSPEAKRHLVFDLGYSGSVGQALAAATGSVIDKLYFWETPDNAKRDASLGSQTRLFMHTTNGTPFNLLLEEICSPCTGGVIDFDGNGNPIFEQLSFEESFKTEMHAMHSACLDFAEAFCQRCGAYTACVRPETGDVIVDIYRYLLEKSPFCNARLLRHIAFPDPLHHSGVPSLEYKIERFLPQRTVFSGTGFEDPRRMLHLAHTFEQAPRLGVHMHIHNPALMDEMVRYLHDFPVPLDLYVTITEHNALNAARHLFSRACIPCLQQVRVLPVPNRGRDVAPWILGMRPYQASYDLFCHVHAKESGHFDFGADWRRYLLENLLLPASLANILALFRQQPKLGCLFPPPFPPLASLMITHGIPPGGLKGELDDASRLLRRMGLQAEFHRTELFFSMGTMLWYRPDALRQLFTFDITLEEFAAEPIGVEGTIAHAIERLPAMLAERNGYLAGMFAAS